MNAVLSAMRRASMEPSSARRSGPGASRASSRLPVTVIPASAIPLATAISEITVP